MRSIHFLPLLALLVSLVQAQAATGQSEAAAKTVVGPANVDLADGAEALRIGNAEDGVRLTRRTGWNNRQRGPSGC